MLKCFDIGFKKPENKNIEIEDKKNFHKLPLDIILKIFEFLSLYDLGNVRLVNNTWDELARDPVLLKGNTINEFNKFFFGNKDWIKAFGPDFIPKKEIKKDIESLPEGIGKILLSPCQINPKANKRVYKTHVFVWIPKTVMIDGKEVNLTIRTIGQLMKKMFFSETEDGYGFIWKAVMDDYGDKAMDKSGWVLLSRDLLLNSRNKSYSEQKNLVKGLADTTEKPYEVPEALPLIVSIFAEYIKSGQTTRLLNNDTDKVYTHCQESLYEFQIAVGGFASNGLIIQSFARDNNDSLGVVALRKF